MNFFSRKRVLAALLLVCVLLLVLSGFWLWLLKTGKIAISQPKYSLVYLDTGEIYVGELKIFPFPALCHGYLLQRTETSAQLLSLAETVWAPASCLRLNKQHISFWAELSSDSQLSQMIKQYQTPIPPTVPTPIPSP